MGVRTRPWAAATAVALALALLVGCGSGADTAGTTGGQSTTTPEPAVTTTAAGATTTDDLRRRDVPPEGVPGQITFLPFTDGCDEGRAGPAVSPTAGSFSLADSPLICVYGFDPASPVAVEVAVPGGRTVRKAVSAKPLENDWSFELGPADPTGDYSITAVQGRRRATGGFAVALPFTPLIVPAGATRGPGGTTFRFAVVSSAPRQAVAIDLFHRQDFIFRYATALGSVTTDDQARASYTLATAPDTPAGTYCLVARPSFTRCAEFEVT